MTMLNSTQARLAWFGQILKARFSTDFVFESKEEHVLKLTVIGSSSCIEFVSAEALPSGSAAQSIPSALWNAAAEGWQTALDSVLPAPGVAVLPTPLIQRTPNGYTIHYDILGLVYWMLTRQEEVGRTDLDEHGRFPATSSHAYKYGYLDRPIIDEWLHILGQVMERTWPRIRLKRHAFSMKVSHDVDAPSRYGFRGSYGLLRSMAGDLIRRHDIAGLVRAPWVRLSTRSRLHPSDPYNTFDWLMDISDQHGLKSAFYFICGRTDASKDADYDPGHPAIRDLMRRIHARGHEIGLHPSYGTYQRPEAIIAEAQRLRRIAQEEGIDQPDWGGRMHYLRWEHPTTLRAWVQAGMDYDTTLSYADVPGFRCGTCFEYPAFDPVADQALPLRIRPLVAMDCTVMAPRYLGLGTGDAALKKFLQLKNACKAVGGSFTLLWHNSQFEQQAERDLYQAVLEG